MPTIEVCIKVKQDQLLPLMQKIGIDEWSFKKGRVEVDMSMTSLVNSALSDLTPTAGSQDLV